MAVGVDSTQSSSFKDARRSPVRGVSTSITHLEDGDRRGKLVVLGAFLNFCGGFVNEEGFLNAFGTYQDYYKRRGILSTVEIGWIASTQFGLLLAGGLFVGPCFDRWGARYLMISGSIITCTALLISAFRYDFPSLISSLGILLGLGNAMMFHPAIGAIACWYDRHRALALGVAIAGASVGGMFWPALTDALLNSFESQKRRLDGTGNEGIVDYEHALKFTFIVTLLVCLPLMVISCCLVKEADLVRTRRDEGDLSGKPSVARPRQFDNIVAQCVTKVHLALAMALFFVWIGAIIPFGFIPMWATECNVRGSWPNYLLTICYSSSFVGRLLLTSLSDKVGRFNVLIVMAFLTGCLIMA